MGTVRSLFFIAVLVTTIPAARAQNVNLEGELDESVRPSARSSGTAIVGAQVLGDQTTGSPEFADELGFTFYLPLSWTAEAICVSTEAANGLYDGRGTYIVSPTGDATTADHIRTAGYPSKYRDQLGGLSASELAIAVRPGACRRAPLDEGLSEATALELALAFWHPIGQSIDSIDSLSLLVNPFDAQKVRVRAGGKSFECVPADVPVTASYSMTCPITLSALGASPALVQIQTLLPGRPPESSFVKLYYPTP